MNEEEGLIFAGVQSGGARQQKGGSKKAVAFRKCNACPGSEH